MKAWSIRLAALLLPGILLPPVGAAERDVRYAFPVQPGCTLKIDTYRGDITVTETEDAAAVVSVHMEVGGDTPEQVQRVLAGLQLEVKEVDNVVTIFARNPRETRARWIWREDEQIGLFYRITVPRRCDVDVTTTKGAITVGRLEGRMSARVEEGTVFFRGIDGSVNASVGQGELIVSRCSGAVTAEMRNGQIRLGTVGGRAALRNAHGGIELMTAKGPIEAAVTAGDLFVGFAREMSAASLRAAAGNITVRIDPAANCTIDASARWGLVDCDLPLAIEPGGREKRKLRGGLNEGGPRVALNADGGNVTIEAGEAPFE